MLIYCLPIVAWFWCGTWKLLHFRYKITVYMTQQFTGRRFFIINFNKVLVLCKPIWLLCKYTNFWMFFQIFQTVGPNAFLIYTTYLQILNNFVSNDVFAGEIEMHFITANWACIMVFVPMSKTFFTECMSKKIVLRIWLWKMSEITHKRV